MTFKNRKIELNYEAGGGGKGAPPPPPNSEGPPIVKNVKNC